MSNDQSIPNRNAGAVLLVILMLLIVSFTFADNESPEINTEPAEGDEVEPTIKITSLVENDVEHPVIANVRLLGSAQGESPELVFTEPLRGLFSTAPATQSCLQGDGCQLTTHNLSNDTHQSAPVRASQATIEGQSQWFVSDIGILHPSNEKAGRIVMINPESGATSVIIDNIGRTVCAEPGDFDADGDIDLTLCEFGHDEGTVSWLENDGGNWIQHVLDPRPGSIHAIPTDVDSDGDLDIVAVLSQLSEEVMLYRNDGAGNFTNESLYKANVTHYGMSGIKAVDLDFDGDEDLVFTNGDTMDFDTPQGINPNELHGVAWLENDGSGEYTHYDLVRNWGAYDTAFVDIEGDGDLDIIAAFFQDTNQFPEQTSRTQIIILEQDNSSWIRHNIETSAQHRFLSIALLPTDEYEVSFVFGSHDPFANGGDLYRLALLQIQVPEDSSVS